MMAQDRCEFCGGKNGLHDARCSAPANVKPAALTIRVNNKTAHHLALRATADPLVVELVCVHTPDLVRAELEFMQAALAGDGHLEIALPKAGAP